MKFYNSLYNSGNPVRFKAQVLLVLLVLLGCSCQKSGLNDFTRMAHPSADTTQDLRSVLRKGGAFNLFNSAARRIGLDSVLPGDSYFTIFAPVDAAMVSAGLDQDHINSMPIDSLKKIILYHVVSGAYGSSALSTSLCNIQANSLRQDISYDPATANARIYQQDLFIKRSGVLYVNGEPVTGNSDTAWTATNGYIWPIGKLLVAPQYSLWDIIKSHSELSMYLDALRIDDSIYVAQGFLLTQFDFNNMQGDSLSFIRMVYDNLPGSYFDGRQRPTVFAPTNAAFAAAGFHTHRDLLDYASRTEPRFSYDANWHMIVTYIPMDSILKSHIIMNHNNKFTNMSLYNDLLYNPDIDNGAFNNVIFWKTGGNSHLTPVPAPLLQFSGVAGKAMVSWNPNFSPSEIPLDPGKHIMARNGVIYEMDQLFYPHN